MRCMWLRSQAHRGKPKGHACRTSPRSVSSRRFAGFAQKAATTDAMDWMYRLSVITITRRHPPYTSRVAPTSYRKKIPQITCRTCTVHVRVLGRQAILRHAHGYAYAAGGRRVSTSTYPRRKRCRHPRPHCALEASASSDPGTLHRSRGSHHQPQAVDRPAVLLRAIRRSAPPLSPPSP